MLDSAVECPSQYCVNDSMTTAYMVRVYTGMYGFTTVCNFCMILFWMVLKLSSDSASHTSWYAFMVVSDIPTPSESSLDSLAYCGSGSTYVTCYINVEKGLNINIMLVLALYHVQPIHASVGFLTHKYFPLHISPVCRGWPHLTVG